LLVVGAAVALGIGSYSALADHGPPDQPGDAVTVDNGDGDVDGDPDGDTNGAVEAGNDNGGQGNGPGTGHAACFAATEHARSVLQGLLAAGKPVGHAIAAVEACGTGGGDGIDGDGSTHPGNGHAFGRGHSDGKPDGVPANGDSEDDGDGPPEHAPARGRR
jgi:hypothetical protein